MYCYSPIIGCSTNENSIGIQGFRKAFFITILSRVQHSPNFEEQQYQDSKKIRLKHIFETLR